MVLTTVESIMQLCLLILAGVAGYKLKLIRRESLDAVNTIVLHFSLPALLFKSFQSEILFETKDLLLQTLGYSVVLQGLCLILAFLLLHRKHPDVNIERASVAFTNNAFIAIPLLTLMFGEIGTFYASTFNFITCLVGFSAIPIMVSSDFSIKECIRKTFNDKVIVCILSMIMLIADIHIPEIIMTPIGWLGDTTTPLAMFLIGCIISYSDFSHMFNLRVVLISILRLVVVPVIIAVIFVFMIHDKTMLMCFTVLGSTPTGTLVTIYTEEAHGNTELSSGIFLLTTVGCAVTIPLIMLMLQMI